MIGWLWGLAVGCAGILISVLFGVETKQPAYWAIMVAIATGYALGLIRARMDA